MSALDFGRLLGVEADGEIRVELVRGKRPRVALAGTVRSHVIVNLGRLLQAQVGDRAQVRVRCPLPLSALDEPEPDIAVVPGVDTAAALVAEVAIHRLDSELREKALIYALAAIPELWVIDVHGPSVLVHRDPRGGSYTRIERAERGMVLEPPAIPSVRIEVDHLGV